MQLLLSFFLFFFLTLLQSWIAIYVLNPTAVSAATKKELGVVWGQGYAPDSVGYSNENHTCKAGG